MLLSQDDGAAVGGGDVGTLTAPREIGEPDGPLCRSGSCSGRGRASLATGRGCEAEAAGSSHAPRRSEVAVQLECSSGLSLSSCCGDSPSLDGGLLGCRVVLSPARTYLTSAGR